MSESVKTFGAGAIVCGVLLAGSCAAAGRSDELIHVYGSYECGAFLANSEKPAIRIAAAAYFRGFVTAYNTYSGKRQVARELSTDTVAAYIQKFCRENPLSHASDGAFRLVRELTGSMPDE